MFRLTGTRSVGVAGDCAETPDGIAMATGTTAPVARTWRRVAWLEPRELIPSLLSVIVASKREGRALAEKTCIPIRVGYWTKLLRFVEICAWPPAREPSQTQGVAANPNPRLAPRLQSKQSAR